MRHLFEWVDSMELLIGAVFAVAALAVLLKLAPKLGSADAQAKGLSALQTIFALLGIVLIAEWYIAEQPDAARLKFDQAVTGFPVAGGKALVTIEVSINNVGGHAARFDKLPYKIFVQQVAPLPQGLPPALLPNGEAPIWRADNWSSLAYRAVGNAASKSYPNWDACASAQSSNCEDGLETVIAPGEIENFYFAAVISCQKDLYAAVSSRFEQPPGPWQWLLGDQNKWWIKQSYLDLRGVCSPARKEEA